MNTSIIKTIAAITVAGIANSAAAQEVVINQASEVAQTNQRIYLHPAHGFPGRPAGSSIKVAINQPNGIARENQKFYLHPAHGFPGQASEPAIEMMAEQSTGVVKVASANVEQKVR